MNRSYEEASFAAYIDGIMPFPKSVDVDIVRSPVDFVIEEAKRLLRDMPPYLEHFYGGVRLLYPSGSKKWIGSYKLNIHHFPVRRNGANTSWLINNDVGRLVSGAFIEYRFPSGDERVNFNRDFVLAVKMKVNQDFQAWRNMPFNERLQSSWASLVLDRTLPATKFTAGEQYLRENAFGVPYYLIRHKGKVDVDCTVIKIPKVLRNEQGQIHAIGEPAILFEDGWGVYAINGVRTRKHLKDGRITPHFLRTCRNAEERRVLMEMVGFDNAVEMMGGVLVHSDGYGDLYRLPHFKEENDLPPKFVKVVNSTPEPDGTYKDYFLRVDPAIDTAEQAVAWTFGVEAGEYQALQET